MMGWGVGCFLLSSWADKKTNDKKATKYFSLFFFLSASLEEAEKRQSPGADTCAAS